MTTKIIYFLVNEKLEKAEFSTADSTEDIRDVFRSAAEASPYDILKLYSHTGSLVNISNHLESNLPENPYTLQAITSGSTVFNLKETRLELEVIENRITDIEKRVLVENCGVPDCMKQLSNHVDTLRAKIEGIEHLSWIGLSKEINGGHCYLREPTKWKKQVPANYKHEDHCKNILKLFKRMSRSDVQPDVKTHLERVDFNNWQWDDAEMLVLLQTMYKDLDFLQYFNIPMYGLISLCKLSSVLTKEELFVLITSAICHDLDHPGYNNNYQINAQTELALRYNDASPLENHHCYVAFKILAKEDCNILKNVPHETFRLIRDGMIRCILATDMARHGEILHCYEEMIPKFDFSQQLHRYQLMMILIKCADISNECRPLKVAEPWIDCLLQEFFNQSDLEKKEGLPVSPLMDRDKVNKYSSQVNFIRFVLLPLFQQLSLQFSQIQEVLLPLQDALNYYEGLAAESTCQQNTLPCLYPQAKVLTEPNSTAAVRNHMSYGESPNEKHQTTPTMQSSGSNQTHHKLRREKSKEELNEHRKQLKSTSDSGLFSTSCHMKTNSIKKETSAYQLTS